MSDQKNLEKPSVSPKSSQKQNDSTKQEQTVIKNVHEHLVAFSRLAESVTIEAIDNPKDDACGLISHQDLLLAATLVTDAKNGRISEFIHTDRNLRLYLIYYHWGFRLLLHLFLAIHHLITICEEPSVKGAYLPYAVTMGIELACLFFYSFRLAHCAAFLSTEKFWRDKKHLFVLIAVILTVIDMCCYVGLMEYGYKEYAYRWSRPLRPMFLINLSENKQIRRAFRNIRKTLPGIANVLILFLLSISLFSLMAQKLFQNRSLKFPNGSPYFINYLDIYFDLYVLVTTANNPDIMMPAFDMNGAYAVFFIAYLVICLFIFMNIFLAVIYNNYRKHLKNEVRKLVYLKRQSLSKAFDLVKLDIDGNDAVDFKRFSTLLKVICPKHSPMLVSILWFVLDSDGDNKIGRVDFLQLADLLNVTVSEIKDRRNVFDLLFPAFYRSKYSKWFRRIVMHKYFRYFFDAMILLNAFLIAFDISEAEWGFLALFTFEIFAKIYTFGSKFFFKRFWNVFDFLVIGSAVVATAVETALDSDVYDRIRTLDFLLVLRVLRLVKIIGGIERFQVIVTTITNLGPSILTYGGVLFVVYYVFAIVGMELFKNKINYYGYENVDNPAHLYCGNPRLNGSMFYQSRYCRNNFNNIFNSFIVLFELMVVNQWHVITNGFVLVTSKGARIYFFAFHLTCVIIVLNIFTAFVLEAFILEYSFCKSKLENAIEKKIVEMGLHLGKTSSHSSGKTDESTLIDEQDGDLLAQSDHDFPEQSEPKSFQGKPTDSSAPDLSQETGIRFHLVKSKNGETLLQRMFENELDVEDIGPSDIHNFE